MMNHPDSFSMNDEDVAWIRENFRISQDYSDDIIRKVAEKIERSKQKELKKVVGNRIELNTINRSILKENMFLPNEGETWLWERAGDLFVDGYFGPCCIWARAALEYMMQKECLRDPNVCVNLKRRIEQPKRNPGLDIMFDELVLAGSWTDADRKPFVTVKNNGDYSAYHRLDKIMSKGAEDREFKFVRAQIGADGLETKGIDVRTTFEFWRGVEERGMAEKSLRALLQLLVRHCGLTKSEVDELARKRIEELEKNGKLKIDRVGLG